MGLREEQNILLVNIKGFEFLEGASTMGITGSTGVLLQQTTLWIQPRACGIPSLPSPPLSDIQAILHFLFTMYLNVNLVSTAQSKRDCFSSQILCLKVLYVLIFKNKKRSKFNCHKVEVKIKEQMTKE